MQHGIPDLALGLLLLPPLLSEFSNAIHRRLGDVIREEHIFSDRLFDDSKFLIHLNSDIMEGTRYSSTGIYRVGIHVP